MTDSASGKVLLAHGGGGRLMGQLIEKTILPRVGADGTVQLTDAAQIPVEAGCVCFTTDSFVVQPLFFPGGDIGKLAVCGTINDIAVCAARPLGLSLSLIIEEGFDMESLERILASVGETAQQAGVPVVTGDTKVVEAGAADGVFINTAAVGQRLEKGDVGFARIQPGDAVIVNGDLGDHGMTIISRRKGIRFESPLQSDCASLAGLIEQIIDGVGGAVKFMRDPTRGGLAAVLNEIARAVKCDVEIEEERLPINPTVRAAADMLGFDLLNIANEGKVVIVADADAADEVVRICRSHPLGRRAERIGRIGPSQPEEGGMVELLTRIGGRRIVQTPYGRELPRIC